MFLSYVYELAVNYAEDYYHIAFTFGASFYPYSAFSVRSFFKRAVIKYTREHDRGLIAHGRRGLGEIRRKMGRCIKNR